MLKISPEQKMASDQFVDLVAGKLGANRAVHTETAIACTARLAGSLLFRSFNLNISSGQAGTVVLSNEANEQGPQLIMIVYTALQKMGIALDETKLGGESADRGGAPELSLVDSLALLQDDALRIVSANQIGLKEAAQAAAVSTGFIVKECSRSLPAEVCFNIAAFGIVEGSKTMPPELQNNFVPSIQKAPWYKFW